LEECEFILAKQGFHNALPPFLSFSEEKREKKERKKAEKANLFFYYSSSMKHHIPFSLKRTGP